jgi:hypothetical protein
MVAMRRKAANESPSIGSSSVSSRRQHAIDAPDPEGVLEGDGFPPGANGHAHLLFWADADLM